MKGLRAGCMLLFFEIMLVCSQVDLDPGSYSLQRLIIDNLVKGLNLKLGANYPEYTLVRFDVLTHT